MAAVDTSASVSPELLEQISAELKRLAEDYDVLVVECDAEIQSVYPYRPLESVRGRGGTDLCPPLKPEFLRQHDVDLAIYFTDGFGDAPEKPPGIPVVWCITENGECPVEWGREVRMSAPDPQKNQGKGRKP
jgi:predicted metal-dependent peptidase